MRPRRMLIAALSLTFALPAAFPALAQSSGLVVCGAAPIEKNKHQVIATEKQGDFDADLAAAGFSGFTVARMGHWTDLMAVLPVYPGNLVAFYDIEVGERAPGLAYGKLGAKLTMGEQAKACILALERPLCEDRRPCP